jgi:hypothetical protein
MVYRLLFLFIVVVRGRFGRFQRLTRRKIENFLRFILGLCVDFGGSTLGMGGGAGNLMMVPDAGGKVEKVRDLGADF